MTTSQPSTRLSAKELEEIYNSIPKEDFTCHTCEDKGTCPYVYDWYNTNGSCLASK